MRTPNYRRSRSYTQKEIDERREKMEALMEESKPRREKIIPANRVMTKIFLPLLNYLVIALLATISVVMAKSFAIMKMDSFTGGFMYVTHSDYIMSEYSLTLGFLSILLFYMFNILYKMAKRYVWTEVLQYEYAKVEQGEQK